MHIHLIQTANCDTILKHFQLPAMALRVYLSRSFRVGCWTSAVGGNAADIRWECWGQHCRAWLQAERSASPGFYLAGQEGGDLMHAFHLLSPMAFNTTKPTKCGKLQSPTLQVGW